MNYNTVSGIIVFVFVSTGCMAGELFKQSGIGEKLLSQQDLGASAGGLEMPRLEGYYVTPETLTAISLAPRIEETLEGQFLELEQKIAHKDKQHARALKRAKCCRDISSCPTITYICMLAGSFAWGMVDLTRYVGEKYNKCQ